MTPATHATTASFEATVEAKDIAAFAELSGDRNPLHTDEAYASATEFGRPLLHGAYSAGLLSRLAGMYIPGTECLLTTMRLRFVEPIRPPARLRVTGELTSSAADFGHVDATITDADTGTRYVDGSYEFGYHALAAAEATGNRVASGALSSDQDLVLVTGATGGLGRALIRQLGARAVGVSRSPREGAVTLDALEQLADGLDGRRVTAIVHCGWPSPDNSPLTATSDIPAAVEHHIAAPLRESIALARALVRIGAPDAILLLMGSTAALPGRHAYRAPLYSIGKSLVPELSRILAVELGAAGMRCAAVIFDVIEAGMNAHLAPRTRLAHVDRSPFGRIPDASEAASQIEWVLANRSFLVSGATLTLTGGALP